MSPTAPAHVPVELTPGAAGRWFRLASAVGTEGLFLADVMPDELDGTFQLAFHLPGDREVIRCHGRTVERVVGNGEEERAERSAIVFVGLDASGKSRIENYVNERLGLHS